MSTTTINCTRDTFISSYSKNTNHAGASRLITDATSSSAVIGKDSIQTALLQFSIPKEVRYKKITKAVLHYYLGSDFTPTFSEVDYTPYLMDNVTAAVTYNSVDANGTLGERKNVKRSYSGGSWIAEDITDIFTNNLTNGIFSVFVGAGGPTPNDASTILSYIGGKAGSNGSYLVVDYEDVVQLPPTITYPVDVYVRQGEPVLFSWVYNSLTAATQTGVTLEWKQENASEYNVINLTTTERSYMAEIDFPAGTIDWRIKVTNDIGETSDYTSAQFVVIGKPAIPVITSVDNKSLTKISWNASDQCAYEIMISDEEGKVLVSEVVHSGEMSYRPNRFLANGTYNIRLRTKNSIELWSDYTSKTVTISAVAPVQPTFEAYTKKNSITIRISRASGTKAAILRAEKGTEYKVIAVLGEEETEYTDLEVRSGTWYRYMVRAYSEGYCDSAPKSAAFEFEGFYLQSDDAVLHLTKSDEKNTPHTEDIEKDAALVNYSGREYPVSERGEFKNRKVRKRMYVTGEEKKILDAMCSAENLFYRDANGNAFACALTAVHYSRFITGGYIAEFDVYEVSRDEVVINV